MRGLVTTRHLLLNAAPIVQEVGWLAYGRCLLGVLFGRRRKTFLECIARLER